MGTWVFVPSQSSYSDSRHALVRAVARFAPNGGDGIAFSSEIHRSDGSVLRRGWTARLDGKDYPVEGDDAFDAVALRRINSRSFLFIYKKADRIVSAQVRDVQPDMKTMMLIQLGVGADGKTTSNTVVFEKE